jgi:pyruvate,water dikinase
VEGIARVVLDQSHADDLNDGDVLVCHTTDPSWSTLFLVSSAVVIDVGSAMSHGAIVARELGIPCVINTRTGTTTIATGSRIRVDGATGVVDIVDSTEET